MKTTLCCILVSMLLCGCGAIMHGRSQDITINSSPTESKVTVNGESRTTPARFSLKRNSSYILKVSKDGYETAEVMINRKLDWTAWADLLLLGVIPIFYDLASGAAYKLSPEEINLTLQRTLGSTDDPSEIRVHFELRNDQLVISDTGLTISVTPVP